MRNIVLISLTFLSKFLFDADLEEGIKMVPLYRGEYYIQSLASPLSR